MKVSRTALPELRFVVGDRVECLCDRRWLVGVIVQLWWAHTGWPADRVAPYQIKLPDGSLIFAPADKEEFIREAAPLLEGQADEPRHVSKYVAQPVPDKAPREEVTWRKAMAPNGKPYWYHPLTKESRWDEPPEDEIGGARALGVMQICAEMSSSSDEPAAPESTSDAARVLHEEVSEAAALGDVAAVTAWLKRAPDEADLIDAAGRTALMAAAHGPKGSGVIALLVAAGASLEATEKHGCTALTLAALRGRVAAAEALLAAGAAVDAADPRGGTALHVAAFLGHSAVARALVDAKADLSLKHAVAGLTAAQIASAAGHTAVLALLKPTNGKASAKAGKGATSSADSAKAAKGAAAASEGGGAASLAWLSSCEAHALAAKLGPHARQLASNARSISLAHAARKSPRALPPTLGEGEGGADAALVSTWLGQGGHADAVDETALGETLLMRAVSSRENASVAMLVEAKATLDAHNKQGQTALMLAAAAGHAPFVALLLRNGADRTLVDSQGRDALALAKAAGTLGAVAQALAQPDERGAAAEGTASEPRGEEHGGALVAKAAEKMSLPPLLSLLKKLGSGDKSTEADAAWAAELAEWLAGGGDVDQFELATGRNLLMFAAQVTLGATALPPAHVAHPHLSVWAPTWPLQDIVSLQGFCARVNIPDIAPPTCIAHTVAIVLHD